ncbi:NAD(P)-binding protein [Tuber magnatum]|uniref:NAD(P)-binding protein n=1 Tax=Tuber magnatum TaxID=42249 RepID=A0A317SHF9_9PEZI|nr:NAD(P)-binding protein [Tuber magnatum]
MITGGSWGLGTATAHAIAKEDAGASAAKVATKISDKYGVEADTVQGDVGAEENCLRIVNRCIALLGDIPSKIRVSANWRCRRGWTRISDFGDLNALSEADWDKVAISVLYLLRAPLESFNANLDGGSFLISSSISATAPTGSAMAYSITKAAGLHLMRCLAQTQGPKVRVHAVLPGLLLTDWGNRFERERIEETRGRLL